MKQKKNQVLIPIILFGGVLVLSIAGLILAQYFRKDQIVNPGDYSNQDQIPRVTAEEAYQAVTNGEVVLIDTRSEAEYQASHADGAINIPVDQTESRLGELDPDIWYITYCT